MRTRIVGLLCAVIGGYVAWTGFAEAAWLFMLGGVMLLRGVMSGQAVRLAC
jgi:hypothetical protein